MGKVMSVVVRKANRFNAENRAQRVLAKDKLEPAPKYPSNLNDMDRVLEVYPNFVEEQNKKDANLNDRLKQVYVTSTDTIIETESLKDSDSAKRLPLDRKTVEDFEYGFKEPELTNISLGRCTLRQALKYLTDHQTDPDVWNQRKIADEYKLKEEVVSDVLKYFKTYQIYIPDIKNSKEQILMQSNLSKKYLPGTKDDGKPL